MTMLIGLMALIGVVGLVFTRVAKDTTLVKNVVFCWLVTVMFLILLGTFLFKGELQIPRSKMMLPFGVYVCLSVISMVLSRYRYAGARELIALVCCGILLFVTVRAVRNGRAFLLVAGMLAAVAALSCVYGILQHYGLDPFFRDRLPWLEPGRTFSTMGHPNFFASFLILALPLLLSVFFWTENGLVRDLIMVLICGVVLCLFHTQSRGAWLGYLVALPLWFFFSLGSRPLRMIFLGPMVCVVVGMLLLLLTEGAREYVVLWALPFWLTAILVLQLGSGQRKLRFARKPAWCALLLLSVVLVSNLLVDRKEVRRRMQATFETEKGSVRTRKILWAGTLKMFKERPVFGWGTGRFGIYFPRFRDPATAGKIAPNTLHAHSEYFEIGAEMGLIGLTVFLWMLGAFIWESIRRIGLAREGLQRMAMVGLLAGCTAILLQAAVSVTTRWVVGRFFLWLGMGLTIAAGRMDVPARRAGKKQRRKRKEMPGLKDERFWRIRVKAARAPGARAVFVLIAVGVAVAAGWWGARVFKSAALTVKGEGYQLKAERVAANLNEAGLFEALREKEGLRVQAIRSYEEAIEWNPYNLLAYYALGHCYNLQRKLEDSLRTYHQLAKLSPDASDIHLNLGIVYANMREWKKSRRELETALSMKIGPLTRVALARTYENLALYSEAEKQYEALLKVYPDDARGLNGLAGLYLRRGDSRKAMELYRKALESDPEDADARLGAGLTYQVFGDDHAVRGEDELAVEHYRRSIAELEVAVAKRPDNVPTRGALALVHLNLGKVYRRMGQWERAAEELRRTIEIDPRGRRGTEARRGLQEMGIE